MTEQYKEDGERLASSVITARDYFAAKAMQALIGHGFDSGEVESDADAAYEIADAMLKARLQP